jgi:hypothetical protein
VKSPSVAWRDALTSRTHNGSTNAFVPFAALHYFQRAKWGPKAWAARAAVSCAGEIKRATREYQEACRVGGSGKFLVCTCAVEGQRVIKKMAPHAGP